LCLFSLQPPAPPSTYTLSLHDALPISARGFAFKKLRSGPAEVDRPKSRGKKSPGWQSSTQSRRHDLYVCRRRRRQHGLAHIDRVDRKSTRLNSSHVAISYAVFCLKKKK